jgi:hypothetical protein
MALANLGRVAVQLDQPCAEAQLPAQGFLAMLAQTRQRAALVPPHQAGVADNVGGQDSRQFALLTGR